MALNLMVNRFACSGGMSGCGLHVGVNDLGCSGKGNSSKRGLIAPGVVVALAAPS